MTPLLQLEDLHITFATPAGQVQAVRGVDLELHAGETLAIVGESGCGKSVLCRSILRLLPDNARISGRILLEGRDIVPCSERQMRAVRGPQAAMLFQDPMASLNPTLPVGDQIMEALRRHRRMRPEQARQRALELLELVGIDDPEARMRLQPHYFSGGMRQRCVLAIALALGPRILLADEPTTALDVTVQARMLDLLRDVQRKTGVGIILVSHDLGVVARVADRVTVMYAGRLVETGSAADVFYDPRHAAQPAGPAAGRCLCGAQRLGHEGGLPAHAALFRGQPRAQGRHLAAAPAGPQSGASPAHHAGPGQCQPVLDRQRPCAGDVRQPLCLRGGAPASS